MLVGQSRAGATHTLSVHLPYRQLLSVVQLVPTAPLVPANTVAVAL